MLTLNRLYFSLLVLLACVSIFPPWFIEAFDLKIYDLLAKYSAPNRPDPRVVIVGIDQKSLDLYGRWPWPRDVTGKLVEKLAGYGVKVTALDITFSTEADKGYGDEMEQMEIAVKKEGVGKHNPEFEKAFTRLRQTLSKDEALANSITKAGNVTTGIVFHEYGTKVSASEEFAKRKLELIRPYRIKLVQRDSDSRDATIRFQFGEAEPNIEIVQQAGAATGFLDAWPDQDGVIRSHPLFLYSQGDIYPSLAFSAVALYLGKNNAVVASYEHGQFAGAYLDDRFTGTDNSGRILLKYYGPVETFPVISVADVMTAKPDDESLRNTLGGKLAVVGATATQIYDLRVTPLGITAGVEVQATAMANILSNQKIEKYGLQQIYDLMAPFILGLTLLFVLKRTGFYLGALFSLTLLAGFSLLIYRLYADYYLWLNAVVPAFTIISGFISVTSYQYLSEQRARRFIKDAFGKYLSPKVISRITEDPDRLLLGGERKIMTAFFSDVAGFTSMSEKLTPRELITILNGYLSEMTMIIDEEEGTVDKYEGDAIIAFWGAPLDMEDHATRCVRSATLQQRKLSELRKKWREENLPELHVRIGINTGQMVVGNVGSNQRMDYTIIGDAVNLAARLEGANKYYGSFTLISEYTREMVGGSFLLRQLDRVRVEGKKQPVYLYEVVEETQHCTDSDRHFVMAFKRAMSSFHRHDFAIASRLFERCEVLRPEGDMACKLYRKRCAELIAAPPPSDWDKVYDLAK